MLTNAYTTLANFKLEVATAGLTFTANEDAVMETAINAASRAIDGYCGWRFWQDATVVDRQFYAENTRCCYLLSDEAGDGISTTTGLAVKIDEDGDGTFETTLTITTDFILKPVNAADRVPVWPYTEVWLADNYSFPILANGRPGVQVTAKFGWPAVPDDITKACLVLAHDLYKSKDAPFGAIPDAGMKITQNRTVSMLLAPYRKPSVG